MKTLYLHIGSPKTATTSIQHFCHDNQEVLNEKGFCYPDFEKIYPRVGVLRNGHFIMAASQEAADESIDGSDKEFDENFEKIYALFEEYDNVILSDEGLWNYGYHKNARVWRQLKKELDKGVFVIKVIVYLRRQDAYLFSWWNQQIKEGFRANSVISWDDIVANGKYVQLDYYKMLEHIASFVGKDNIIVRLFDRNAFFGGTIYKDFMNCIGLDFTDEYTITSEMTNLSLTKNNNEIKRILNGVPELEMETNNHYRNCLTQLSETGQENDNWSMFSEDEYVEFMQRFEDGNQRIAKEYLNTDDALFDMQFKGAEKWKMDNEYIIEDVIRFFGTTTTQLLQENRMMKKEIISLQKELASLKYALKHPVHTLGNKVKNASTKKED